MANKFLDITGLQQVWDLVTGKITAKIEGLADNKSIEYDSETSKISIKGINDTDNTGKMITRNSNGEVEWVTPVSDESIASMYDACEEQARVASTYASNANSSWARAEAAATKAEAFNKETVEHVDKKFWWGTMEEYNKESTSLEEDTIYFVQLDGSGE